MPVVPGKDVTLYVPTDTPPAVVRFMNRLKDEGRFSEGIMEIVTGHVLHAHSASVETSFEVAGVAREEEAFDASDRVVFELRFEEPAASEEAVGSEPGVPREYSPDDLFRLASRNAGKLLGHRDNDERSDREAGSSDT